VKKLVIFALVAVLAVSLLGPATAAKKKKKKKKVPTPIELQFFLRTNGDCAAPFLSLTDGEDGDCVYGDGGIIGEIYQATGILDTVNHYVASDGIPLTLDTSRHVTGSIGIRGWNGAGVGPAETDITLFGTIAGEEVELATFNESYTAGPQHVQMIELDLELDPKFAGAVIEGLKLDVYAHGNTIAGRGVEHDEPVAFITIPALQ
jgi:hypothetical protein